MAFAKDHGMTNLWSKLLLLLLVGWFFLSGSVFSLIVTTLSFDSKVKEGVFLKGCCLLARSACALAWLIDCLVCRSHN